MTWASSPAPTPDFGTASGRKVGLGDLRVEGLLFAGPAGVGLLGDLADEDRRRRVVEAFADRLADADADPGAAGADLLGVAEVDLFPLPGQVRRVLLAAVPVPLQNRLAGRHRGVTRGKDGLRRRRLVAVEEGGAFDPLAAAAEGRSEERRVGKECRSRWSPY